MFQVQFQTSNIGIYPDIGHTDMENILTFICKGEITLDEGQAQSFVQSANKLGISLIPGHANLVNIRL